MSTDDTLLDNPSWHALTTHHSTFAVGDALARRYPSDISPIVGLASNDEASYTSLAALIQPGEVIVVGGPNPPFGDRWELMGELNIVQMVCNSPTVEPLQDDVEITSLSHNDVPAMLALIEITHPGPFLPRTIELGQFLAIWQEGQLAAMAGRRLHLPGYCEISAVCTHPNFQRRGYARRLVQQLVHEIQSAGEVPFLHVAVDNHGAITLYESLGFKRRMEVIGYVLLRR